MENVLLVVHILTCIALIGVVLVQRSEGGGALGIGGGGGGGLMSGRGAASVLTRSTMILAAVFFTSSLLLTTIATRGNQKDSSIAGEIKAEEAVDPLELPDGALIPGAGLELPDATIEQDSLDQPVEDVTTLAPDEEIPVDVAPVPEQ